jgi:hypothetical protein
MSLTFYRAPMSTASVTELVLAELGTPHEAGFSQARRLG